MDYSTIANDLDERFAHIDNLPDRHRTYYRLIKCRPQSKEWPDRLVLDLSPDDGDMMTDFIQNSDRLIYLSPRGRRTFEELGLGPAVAEYLPFYVRDKHGRTGETPYYIVNLLLKIDCLDRERSTLTTYPSDPSEILSIKALQLRVDAIPPGARLFRLGEMGRITIIRSDLVEAITSAGLTGLRVLPLGSRLT